MSVKICDRCRAKHEEAGRYCAECAAIRKGKASQSKVTNPFYGTARWKQTKARKLRRDPLCEDCKTRGVVTPATIVDHIIEISDGGARLDPSNLMSMCRKCHARKTARERKRRERGY